MSKLALSPALIEGLGLTIVHSLWQATVLAGLLWVISRTIQSAAWRYRLAYGTLLAQLAVSVGTFIYLYEPVRAGVAEPLSLVVFVSGTVSETVSGGWSPTVLLPWVVLLWALALCVGIVRLGWSFGRVRGMRRRVEGAVDGDFARRVRSLADRLGYTGRLNIALSRYVDGPALVGHLKPVLLFPVTMLNNLSADEAEAVILHELAHLRRQDHWWNLLQCLIEVLFQYHPMVWWIGARIREEREHCCDDLVLAHGPGGLPYARALLYFETHRSTPATAVALTNTPGGLLGRVQRFLHHQNIPYQMKSRLFLLPLLALFALVATAAYAPDLAAESTADPVEAEVAADPVLYPAPITSTAPAAAPQMSRESGVFSRESGVFSPESATITPDTLPPGRHRVSSHTNDRSIDVTVDNQQIERLEVDGREIPEVDYPKYLQRVEDLLNGKKADGSRWMTPEYNSAGGTSIFRFENAPDDGTFLFEGFDEPDGMEGFFEKVGEGWELRFEGMGEEFEDLGLRFEAMGERIGEDFESLFDLDKNRGVYRMRIGEDSDFFDHHLFSNGKVIQNGDTLFFEGGAGTEYPGLEGIEFDRITMKMRPDSITPEKMEREELLREYEAMKAERDALLRERARQRRLRGEIRREEEGMRNRQEEMRQLQGKARVRLETDREKAEDLRAESERLRQLLMEESRAITEEALRIAEEAQKIAEAEGRFHHYEIIKQLQDEGMLPAGELKKMSVNTKSLTLNGKKASAAAHARYLEIYEALAGEPMQEGDSISVSTGSKKRTSRN